jgi:hypothetical protein
MGPLITINRILRAIANAPWYVTNHTLHSDLKVPYVRDVIHERIEKHHAKTGRPSQTTVGVTNTTRIQ